MNLIGIDVDSVNLVCRIRRKGKDFPEKVFTNDAAGHGKLIRWATARGAQARVCLEATGVYSMPLALALHAAQGVDVMVVNPRVIKHFTTVTLQRGKTDSQDAASILEFVQRMPFRPWHPPCEEVLELQHICRRIVQLNTELTRERNRHKQACRLGAWGRVVARDTTVNMNHLKRRIAHLEDAAISLAQSVPELSDKLQLLVSATGIAYKTGPRILAELMALPADMKPQQWVAHAGLDPRAHESGSSTQKPRRISKAGNRYLRDALFFPALVASRRDPNVRAFYEKLVGNGKKPKQAIVAVMRKLLLAIWGMFHHRETWNGEKFYRMA